MPNTSSRRTLDDLFPAVTESASETTDIGRALADRLRPGDVVALYGDLGAGKTVLSKGICSALGVDVDEVNSPTFTILNEYATGSIPVFHFDAYRIKSPGEFFDLGYEDYFFDGGITIVEWADRVEGLIPDGAIRLRMEHVGGNRRRVSLESEHVE